MSWRRRRRRGQSVELLASHHPGADEMDAYERVLGDAMAGDATLFAREDYVEEAWRIVDPVLKAGTPVYDYEPGSWGRVRSIREFHPLVGGITRRLRDRVRQRIGVLEPWRSAVHPSLHGGIHANREEIA